MKAYGLLGIFATSLVPRILFIYNSSQIVVQLNFYGVLIKLHISLFSLSESLEVHSYFLCQVNIIHCGIAITRDPTEHKVNILFNAYRRPQNQGPKLFMRCFWKKQIWEDLIQNHINLPIQVLYNSLYV